MFIKKLRIMFILWGLNVCFANLSVFAMDDPETESTTLSINIRKDPTQDNFDPELTLAQKQDLLKNLSSKAYKIFDVFNKTPSTRVPLLRLLSLFTDHDYYETVLNSLSLEKDLSKDSRLTFFTHDIVATLPSPPTIQMTDEQKQRSLRNRTVKMLEALQGIPPQRLPLLKDFFANNTTSRSNPYVTIGMIHWAQIFDYDDMKRVLKPVIQWSMYHGSPFCYTSPLYLNLKKISGTLVRSQILSIFLKYTFDGKYSLHHLSEEYGNTIIPLLAALSPEERSDIEDFFTPEVIEVVKTNEIFLEVLDRLTRHVVSITQRKKHEWSEKIVTETVYGHYTRDQRKEFMKTLTPEFLMQAEFRGFYKLLDSKVNKKS